MLRKTIPSRALLILFLLISGLLLFGCEKKEEIKTPSYEDLKITVVDTREPHLPGAPAYQDQVTELVKKFEADRKVKVNLVFLERDKVQELLSKGKLEDDPDFSADLCYSGEWPFYAENGKPVDNLPVSSYLDAAASYWTRDGKMVGIPSYIHWFCVAANESLTGITIRNQPGVPFISPENLKGKVGYWPDSVAFFKVALDPVGWSAQNLMEYTFWVKDSLGTMVEDPLEAWTQGSLKGLYPVNPYLLRWLKVSNQESKIFFFPLPSYYTVPGYIVLSREEANKTVATELGILLARQRGRWAARAMGGIPACVDDMTIFNLESGFTYDERQMILEVTKATNLQLPTLSEFLRNGEITTGLEEEVKGFLSGKSKEEELQGSILKIFQVHTNP